MAKKYDDLVRRALARRAMGRGTAATDRRLQGVDRPTATINDPAAPTAISGTAQPVSGSKVKPKGAKPKRTPSPQGGLDPTTKAILDAAVKLRYGGQEQALNEQLANNARFGSGIADTGPSGWYTQAIEEIKRQQQPVPVVQAPGPIQATGDPLADQAAQSRANLNAQFQQMQARDAQAQNDFLANIAAGMRVQQGNTVNQTNRDRQNLLAQQSGLKAEEGAFRTTTLSDLQAAQQKAAQEQAKVQASIAIAEGKLNLARDILNNVTIPDARSKAADRRADNRRSASDPSKVKTQLEIDFFNKHGYWPPTGPPKKGRGSGDTFTRTQGETSAHHKIIRNVNNAISDVQDLRKQGFSDKAIKGALRKDHVPADVLDAAFTLASGGKLNASQIKQLKLAGLIAAPRDWKPPKLKLAPHPEVSVGYPTK